MSKVIEWIYDQKWAITPAGLRAIIEIADRHVEGKDYSSVFHKMDAKSVK